MRAASATATTATAAASAAAGLSDVIGGRNAAQFEGHSDVFADFLLQALQFLLGGEKFTGDLIFKQGFAGRFEFTDFHGTKLHTGVLLVVQFLATLMDTLILKPRSIIVEESFHTLLELQKCWVAGNLGTEFPGFYDDGGIFSSDGHTG